MAKRKAKKKAAKKSVRKVTKKAKKKVSKKKSVRKARVNPIPPGFATVSVHLTVDDGDAAMTFYEKAFGGKAGFKMTGPDGSFMHGEVKIGNSTVMIGQEMPGGPKAPHTIGGSPCVVSLYVKDADDFFIRAAQSGARVTQPLQDMFWGDRYGQLVDPFGHTWAIASHIEDVTPREMAKRMQAMMGG